MIVELLTVPAFIFFIGALLLHVLPEKVRSSAFILFPLLALGVLFSYPNGYEITAGFGEYELSLVYVDELSRVFLLIFALITAVGGIYALHITDLTQQTSALYYAGGALGVTLAGDYFTLFVFWEIMAVSSTYLIWARRTKETDDVGMRYLLVHIFGGGLLFSGILWHIAETGSIAITQLPDEYSVSSVLMLLGVAVNSAIPPLHAWIADAYPKATITGAVFMSAFTTKSAVYVLVRMFSGWDILIYAGAIMTIYGVVYAIITNDIRQILAYHIVSQVGYMVTGIGIGTEMAINGTTAHAYSHILYKSLLFMGTGAVIYATGKYKLSDLGGLGKEMKTVLVLYMIAAFSISGFPLFNGFISKAMVVSAAGYAHYETVQLVLLLASVGTFLSVGIKLPYFTWFGERNPDVEVRDIPMNMKVAMGIGAFLCVLYGVYPDLLYRYLPFSTDYQPYTVYHLVEITQITVMTFIGFWLLKHRLKGKEYITIDTDWFYRKPADAVRLVFVQFTDKAFDKAEESLDFVTAKVNKAFKNPVTWVHPISAKDEDSSAYIPEIGSVLGFILFSAVFILLGWYIF